MIVGEHRVGGLRQLHGVLRVEAAVGVPVGLLLLLQPVLLLSLGVLAAVWPTGHWAGTLTGRSPLQVPHHQLHHLLQDVEEEEAGGDDDLREEDDAELFPRTSEDLPGVREDVEDGGGQQSPGPAGEEEVSPASQHLPPQGQQEQEAGQEGADTQEGECQDLGVSQLHQTAHYLVLDLLSGVTLYLADLRHIMYSLC